MNKANYKTDLRNVYNTIADHFSKTRSFLWPEFAAFSPYIKRNDHVIDIGCGNGRLIEFLQDKDCTYLGIDQSEELLHQARMRWPHSSFDCGDMSVYHYGRERFDAAFFIASIHHLASSDEQLKVLQRVFTALKPGGHVFITVWNLWQPKYRKFVLKTPYHHSYIPYTKGNNVQHRFYYAFTKSELKQLCEQAGFQTCEIWYSNKDQVSTRLQARNICFIGKKLATSLR